MFHLWRQSWILAHSSIYCKADPAKQSTGLHIAFQPRIRSFKENLIKKSNQNQTKPFHGVV